jgi:signal transduction histidine kinase
MSRLLGWVQEWVVQIAITFLFGGCFLRFLIQYSEHPLQKLALLLLAAWLAIFIAEPAISRRWSRFFYLYLVIQTSLIFFLLYRYPDNDNIAILFAGLSMQIMSRLPPKQGIAIIAVFTPLTIIGVRQYYDIAKTIPIAIIYTAANAFLGACGYGVRKAQEEREKESLLLLELQEANRQLLDSTRQVEQLTIARERSRLALELHDSVTQTIFSMTLATRAAIILVDQDLPRVGVQLDHLDQLVRSALEELKKLVLELKPESKNKESLVALLQGHSGRLKEDDLQVTFQVVGNENLTTEEIQCLYRIAQESLNNIVKHAHTTTASIILDFHPPQKMEIEDRGVGFDIKQYPSGVGLSGMKERAAGIGWSLEVKSQPGGGTRISVEKSGIEKGISHVQT